MPKVTSVEKQKKNPKRFNIFLDGQFAFGADEDLVVNFRLIVGKEIKSEDLNKLLFESEAGKLIDRVYSLLGVRQRSEKEIRDYLKTLSFKRKVKGNEEISELVVENLIEKLKSKDLINDQNFAKAWVDARRRSKSKGKIALKQELFQKGIDREIIEEVLSDEFRVHSSELSEEQLAKQALEKKLKSFSNLPYLEAKKKAFGFLVRRGFEYSVIKEVVEKLIKKEYY
ncbi:RecX family transcriptional regulator [Candidatus Daviesbacteria bacterium]|nr:RecX family transcriptional regulator [Candidatus Daviesbacteria bacterium]